MPGDGRVTSPPRDPIKESKFANVQRAQMALAKQRKRVEQQLNQLPEKEREAALKYMDVLRKARVTSLLDVIVTIAYDKKDPKNKFTDEQRAIFRDYLKEAYDNNNTSDLLDQLASIEASEENFTQFANNLIRYDKEKTAIKSDNFDRKYEFDEAKRKVEGKKQKRDNNNDIDHLEGQAVAVYTDTAVKVFKALQDDLGAVVIDTLSDVLANSPLLKYLLERTVDFVKTPVEVGDEFLKLLIDKEFQVPEVGGPPPPPLPKKPTAAKESPAAKAIRDAENAEDQASPNTPEGGFFK